MTSRLRRSIPLIASGLACACSAPVPSTTSSPPTSTTAEPINSGGRGQPPQPINSSDDPVSKHFYQYTVALSGGWGECTGVIIAPTLILTAAHCQADGSTVVRRYTDTGTKDNGGEFAVIPNNPTAVQSGVTCAGSATNDLLDPSTCMSNGHFADLAIVTLQQPINTPSPTNPLSYYSVTLGPEGQYSNFFDFSNWAVGAGWINGVPNNDQNLMWIPAIISNTDTNSCRLVGACNTPGYFTGTLDYGGDGDSGGPLYQEAETLNGDFVLVGIMHSSSASRAIDANGNPPVSVWTSVEYTANYEWIKSQIAAAPVLAPNLATFGASQ